MRASWLMVIAAGALAVAAPARADERRVRALALPTRHDHAALARRAGEVAAELARRLGATPVRDRSDSALTADLKRALDTAASGALDAAARALDTALEAGARAPHLLDDPDLFVTAHVARVAIALARNEERRARELLARALEYDPGFLLRPGEDSPRVQRALAQVRSEVGPRPTVRVATLGQACRDGAEVLVAARGLPDGAIELMRYDHCRLVARIAATASRTAAQLALDLDPRAPTPPYESPEPRRFYQRAWFWTAVGVVAVGAGAAVYFGTRGEEGLRVEPHL